MGDGKKAVRYARGQVICILLAALFTLGAYVNTGRIQQQSLQSFYYYDYQMPADLEGFKTIYEDSVAEKKNLGVILRGKDIEDSTLFLNFPKGKGQYIRSLVLQIRDGFLFDTQCTLFYRTRDGLLDQEHRQVVSLPKGETVVYFSLPEKADYKMSGIRVDFEDKYHLVKAMISEEPLTASWSPEEKPSNRYTLICFLAALFLAECIWFNASAILNGSKRMLRLRKKLVCGLLLTGFAAVNGAFAAEAVFEIAGKQCTSFWMIFSAGAGAAVIWELYLLFRETYTLRGWKLVRQNYGIRREKDILRSGLFWSLTAVILMRILLAFHDSLADISEDIDRAHVLIPLAVILVQVLLLALLYKKYILSRDENEISFQKVYLFLFFAFGLAYLFLFLPFVSPDEPDHYISAYRISDLLLGQIGQLGDKRLLMRMEDYQFFEQQKYVLDPKYYMSVTGNLHLHRHVPGYVIAGGPMVTNSIFSYFPAGIGIAIARVLNLSAGMAFYFGRTGNLLFFAFCFYLMMKKIPFGDTALFTLVMLPMSLHVAGSFSYDGVTFCITAMFVIRVMQMICRKGRISDREYLSCFVNGALMAPSKLVYLPLLLLVFLIPGNRLADSPSGAWKRKAAIIFFSVIFMATVMFAVNMLGADSAIRDMVQNNASVNMVAWAHEEGYTISWILHHPLRYLAMCFRTMFIMADTYFYTLIGTKLGWLNIGVPELPVVLGFFAFLLAVNIRDVNADTFLPDGKTKGFISVLCACSVMLTLLVMALNWTPLSQNYISGVQGRYFLPLLIPAIWVFRTRTIQVESSIRKSIVFFEAAVNILLLIYLFTNTMV